MFRDQEHFEDVLRKAISDDEKFKAQLRMLDDIRPAASETELRLAVAKKIRERFQSASKRSVNQ